MQCCCVLLPCFKHLHHEIRRLLESLFPILGLDDRVPVASNEVESCALQVVCMIHVPEGEETDTISNINELTKLFLTDCLQWFNLIAIDLML